jgi:hypothetical protein
MKVHQGQQNMFEDGEREIYGDVQNRIKESQKHINKRCPNGSLSTDEMTSFLFVKTSQQVCSFFVVILFPTHTLT